MRRVCVFCGSAVGLRPAYSEAARALGAALVERGLGLVYGGGHVGLMGVVADAVMAGGGEVIGVIPRGLHAREVGHEGVTELRVVETMHERKAEMAALSDGFLALPGGLGTLEEIFEVWTWAQLGIHGKPVCLLDVDGYWQPMVQMIERMVEQGFVLPAHRQMLHVATQPAALLEHMAGYTAPALTPWLSADQS